MKGFQFTVSGRVQGVWFRASTKKQADNLGLSGWVRNLPDGQVQGQVSGEEKNLELFRQWLSQGPDLARVDELKIEICEPQAHQGFSIR